MLSKLKIFQKLVAQQYERYKLKQGNSDLAAHLIHTH